MRRLDEKVSHAAHIKRHTRGTSNEISFSVLDAAKNAQDEDSRGGSPRPHRPILGAISMFTLSHSKKPISTPAKERGITLSTGEFVSAEQSSDKVTPPSSATTQSSSRRDGASPVPKECRSTATSGQRDWSPRDEVERRKSARKKARMMFASIAGVAIITLFALGLGALVSNYQANHQKKEMLATSVESIMAFDEDLESFAMLVSDASAPSSQIDADDIENRMTELEGPLSDLEEALPEVQKSIEDLQPKFENTGDLEASNHALEAINARSKMLASGREVVNNRIESSRVLAVAENGWSAVLQADTAARDAAALANDTNVDNVNESMTKSYEVIALLEEARELLTRAQGASGVDMSGYLEYVGIRVEAQRHAIASDQAYLDRDKEAAASENDLYNELDAKAVAIIKELEGSPVDQVESDYAHDFESQVSSFETERARAESVNAILRDYLGSISK